MSGPEGTGPDPARSLALLWRTAEPPSRARRGPALSVDRIVDEAITLADAEGLDAMTLRRVAQRLQAAPMSLYTYVPGRAELLDLMLDRAYAAATTPAMTPGDWRANLEAVARANHALYLSHPWLLALASGRPVLGPGVIAKYDAELAALDGVGLSDVDLDSVLSLMLSFVHGAAREAVQALATVERSGLTEQEWWDANGPLLARVFDPVTYPLAARVGTAAGQAHGAAHDPAHAFEFGLARVLDGIAVYLRGRTPTPH